MTDDLIFGQPVNTLMRLGHRWGGRQPLATEGVSVVVVNWNTLDVLMVTLEAIRRFSPATTEIIVVDNGSTDGSRAWLRTRPFSCRVALLPANIGHGRGLDVGVAMSRRPTGALPLDPQHLAARARTDLQSVAVNGYSSCSSPRRSPAGPPLAPRWP